MRRLLSGRRLIRLLCRVTASRGLAVSIKHLVIHISRVALLLGYLDAEGDVAELRRVGDHHLAGDVTQRRQSSVGRLGDRCVFVEDVEKHRPSGALASPFDDEES